MPLIQGKSKEAFSKNVSTEMHAGKPQNQSVAIAYSEKAKAEHRKHLAMGGKVSGCSYCMGGYDEGGTVSNPPTPPPDPDDNKKKTIGDIIGYPKGASLAEGGDVMDDDHETMIDQCVGECMDAIKSGDKMAFRDALEFVIGDILSKMKDED